MFPVLLLLIDRRVGCGFFTVRLWTDAWGKSQMIEEKPVPNPSSFVWELQAVTTALECTRWQFFLQKGRKMDLLQRKE